MSFYSQTIDFLNAAAKTKDAMKLAQAARDVVLSCARRFCAWKGVTVGEDDTLIELIHLPDVEEFVGTAEAVSALDFVRILGTNADHAQHVKRTCGAHGVQVDRIECIGC